MKSKEKSRFSTFYNFNFRLFFLAISKDKFAKNKIANYSPY